MRTDHHVFSRYMNIRSLHLYLVSFIHLFSFSVLIPARLPYSLMPQEASRLLLSPPERALCLHLSICPNKRINQLYCHSLAIDIAIATRHTLPYPPNMSVPLNISHNIHTQTPITKETAPSGTNVKLNSVSCITLEQPQKDLDGNKSDYAQAKTESKNVEGGQVKVCF